MPWARPGCQAGFIGPGRVPPRASGRGAAPSLRHDETLLLPSLDGSEPVGGLWPVLFKRCPPAQAVGIVAGWGAPPPLPPLGLSACRAAVRRRWLRPAPAGPGSSPPSRKPPPLVGCGGFFGSRGCALAPPWQGAGGGCCGAARPALSGARDRPVGLDAPAPFPARPAPLGGGCGSLRWGGAPVGRGDAPSRSGPRCGGQAAAPPLPGGLRGEEARSIGPRPGGVWSCRSHAPHLLRGDSATFGIDLTQPNTPPHGRQNCNFWGLTA